MEQFKIVLSGSPIEIEAELIQVEARITDQMIIRNRIRTFLSELDHSIKQQTEYYENLEQLEAKMEEINNSIKANKSDPDESLRPLE